jgi:hypothetical protein
MGYSRLRGKQLDWLIGVLICGAALVALWLLVVSFFLVIDLDLCDLFSRRHLNLSSMSS